MDRNDVIDLFIRRRDPLLKWLCTFYPLPRDILDKYKHELDWDHISRNTRIDWTRQLIEQHSDKLSFYYLGKNPSLPWDNELIDRYPEFLTEYCPLSVNTGLHWSPELLRRYAKKWNWNYITQNSGIKWTQDMLLEFDLFGENLSVMNGDHLWTSDLMLKYGDRINWAWLTYNPNIFWSEDLIDSVKHFWKRYDATSKIFVTPWSGISQNPSLNWSEELIERYIRKPFYRPYGLVWDGLSRNEKIPFQNGLLEKYEDQWDWSKLSFNNGTNFTMEQIEKFSTRFVWNTGKQDSLSINASLPWGEELLEKYKDKWDWWQLGYNQGIPWTKQLLYKFNYYIDQRSIFNSKRLPWDINLLVKNESKALSCWRHTDIERLKWFYEKIFEPILDDELVEELLFKLSNPFHVIKQGTEDDEFIELSKHILESVQLPNEEYKRIKDKQTLADQIQVAIARIALDNDNGNIIVHKFLSDYMNFDDHYFDQHVIEVLNEFITELENFFKKRGDLEYLVSTVERHNEDMRRYEAFRAQGGHISQNFDYLHNCIEQKGQKTLALARLFVTMQNLRDLLSNHSL